jgi:hypothetical protein
MNETTTLPACLTGPGVLFVDANDWQNLLFVVQKRTGLRSGWFVVLVTGQTALWDGPHTQRKALARLDQQLDYLQAILAHVGALECAVHPPSAQRSAPQWDVKQWEDAWQVVSRRLTGAPSIVAESPEFQTLKSGLDRTFLAGDVDAFFEAMKRLIQRCEEVSQERGIAPWWTVAH